MHEHLKSSLQKKGWQREQIEHVHHVFSRAQQNKHPLSHGFDSIMYWFSLLVAVIGNFIVAIALLPFLLIFKGFFLFVIVTVIGFSFGMLFEVLIRSLWRLEKRHHLLLVVLVPSIALLTIISMVVLSNQLESSVGLESLHNPLIIAIAYAASFMIPYLFYQTFSKK